MMNNVTVNHNFLIFSFWLNLDAYKRLISLHLDSDNILNTITAKNIIPNDVIVSMQVEKEKVNKNLSKRISSCLAIKFVIN